MRIILLDRLKDKNLWLGFVLLMMGVSPTFAQKKPARMFGIQPHFESITCDPVVCPMLNKDFFLNFPPPEEYLQSQKKGTAKRAKSKFIVTYTGFTPEAQAAFQKAVDIWESILISPVDIRIQANWRSLGLNVLGSASPSTFFRFAAAPRLNTWYPIALAEKLIKNDLNPGQPDIVASFNSANNNWHFDPLTPPPAGKFDLLTVVLHELGHGLGFFAIRDIENGQGSFRLSGFPGVFNLYVEDAAGRSLNNATVYPEGSTALADALRAPLFFNSPIMKSKNMNQRAELYSPVTFVSGSSTSHLNTDTYAMGIDGLMVHNLPSALRNENPGPITRNMFADMGWVHTYVEPDTVQSTEIVNANPFVVKAKVTSDSILNVASIKLHYSLDSFKTKQTLTMAPAGMANTYSANIPAPGNGKTVGYYVSASDNTNREYLSPSQALDFNRYFYFFVGTDNVAPTIQHSPITTTTANIDTLAISAVIRDIFGINAATVEYKINNGASTFLTLNKDPNDSEVFLNTIRFTSGLLKNGDIISYRITAEDKSAAKNKSNLPQSGFFQVTVEGFGTPRQDYDNNFNAAGAGNDFFGNEFSVTTPAGFSNAAIHSSHPYKDGSGPNDESNYIYNFRFPIIVRNTNAWIRFDEIVLVEPGEPGTVFGDPQFWDYVIVEGSSDQGKTWKFLLDGYDSRANTSWLNKYNSSKANNNSTATGDPSLFKERFIDLRKTFAANETVVIRFRLFADQAANGWGWAIDNLQIQGSLTATEEFNVFERGLKIYPNPASERMTFQAKLNNNAEYVQFSILDLLGSPIVNTLVPVDNQEMEVSVDLRNIPAGLYLAKLKVNNREVIKKVIVRK